MTSQRNKANFGNNDSSKSTLLIAGLLGVLTLGLIAVTWFCVTSLQDNSERIRKFKVKESVESTPKAYGKFIFGNRDEASIDDKMPHEASHKTWLQAQDLQAKAKFKEAIEKYQKSLDELEKDINSGHTDPDDPRIRSFRFRGMAECYTALGDLNRSLDNWNQAISACPKALYYRQRAAIYRQLGEKKMARADVQMAKKLKQTEDPRRQMVDDFMGDAQPAEPTMSKEERRARRRAQRRHKRESETADGAVTSEEQSPPAE